jgi:hypothetical protein
MEKDAYVKERGEVELPEVGVLDENGEVFTDSRGNIFFILSCAMETLVKAHKRQEAVRVYRLVTQESKSYKEALEIIQGYVKFVPYGKVGEK